MVVDKKMGFYKCKSCGSKDVVESYYREDDEDIEICRCLDCYDWGSRDSFIDYEQENLIIENE